MTSSWCLNSMGAWLEPYVLGPWLFVWTDTCLGLLATDHPRKHPNQTLSAEDTGSSDLCLELVAEPTLFQRNWSGKSRSNDFRFRCYFLLLSFRNSCKWRVRKVKFVALFFYFNCTFPKKIIFIRKIDFLMSFCSISWLDLRIIPLKL